MGRGEIELFVVERCVCVCVCVTERERRIFGPKMATMTRGWRKRRNYELCNLFSSPHAVLSA
jgi:hypothetical protein